MKIVEAVAQRVDGPADGDDVAHGLEGGLLVPVHLVGVRGHLAGLAREGLVEDEAPAEVRGH